MDDLRKSEPSDTPIIDLSRPHDHIEAKKKPHPPYSFSQLSLFAQCPRKYWCRYAAGLKTPPNKATELGTAVHQSIEQGINWLIESGKSEVDPEEFQEAAKRSYDKSIRKDCIRGIEQFSLWSPQLVAHRSESPEISTEWKFGLTRKWEPVLYEIEGKPEPSCLFRGSIDLLSVHHHAGVAYVWDIKSGRTQYRIWSKHQTPHRQLTTYAWAIFCIFPHIKYVGTTFFNIMSSDRPEKGILFQREQAEKFGKNWIMQNVNSIESKNYQKLDDWPCQQNPYCRNCEYREGCPLWQKIRDVELAKAMTKYKRSDNMTPEIIAATLASFDEDLVDADYIDNSEEPDE